jgi:hypothetical protein
MFRRKAFLHFYTSDGMDELETFAELILVPKLLCIPGKHVTLMEHIQA